MDAIALLKADHKTVETLFRKFEQAGRNARNLKRQMGDQMVQERPVHAAIEEQAFYPAARNETAALTDDVHLALDEHPVPK